MTSQKRLKELIKYNKKTGVVTRLVWRGGTSIVGTEVRGQNQSGYLRMHVDGKLYYLHRLIWLYVTGVWPTNRIDHKDLNKANNRWKNLREATHGQNTMNRVVRSNSRSGYKGVTWTSHVRMYRVRIMSCGKRVEVGYFPTIAEAHAAYCAIAKKLHGKFMRAN